MGWGVEGVVGGGFAPDVCSWRGGEIEGWDRGGGGGCVTHCYYLGEYEKDLRKEDSFEFEL